MTDGERPDLVPSVQLERQEMQILTDHLTHPSPITAVPVEIHSKDVLLPEVSQHDMEISVEGRREEENLPTHAASDDELAEEIALIQASFHFLDNACLEANLCLNRRLTLRIHTAELT